jgi:glycosyltransferase involved in cell wall biosynthesis
MMHVSVIVTTYNRPDALAVVLEGYLAQTDRTFGLIIADDGSTDETKEIVSTYRRRASFPVEHVWQEDAGFRAAAVRNRALAATDADYIIFSDGDCIPLPDFVARHCLLAEKGWFTVGNRILLSEVFSRRILSGDVPVHAWNVRQWIGARMKGHTNRWLPLLSFSPRSPFRKARPYRWEGAMTCNLSAWREDLLFVNGFDETYSGWGLEDSDLVIRLIQSGLRRKSARFAAPVLHLWHRQNDRSSLTENRRLLEHRLQSKEICAYRGVRQYIGKDVS